MELEYFNLVIELINVNVFLADGRPSIPATDTIIHRPPFSLPLILHHSTADGRHSTPATITTPPWSSPPGPPSPTSPSGSPSTRTSSSLWRPTTSGCRASPRRIHTPGRREQGKGEREGEGRGGWREEMLNMNIQKYYCLKKSLMHLLSHFHRFCLSGPNDLLTREPQEFVGVLGDC